MRSNSMVGSALLALGVSLAGVASAGQATAGPDLGVARVSSVQGDVATRRGDSGDWIATAWNSPLVEGDSIRTTGEARAEVQLAFGNFVRIIGDSEVQFIELAEQSFRVRVLRGTAMYSELPDSEADIDIETPAAAVRPRTKGRYRIFVSDDWTRVDVREGRTEIAFEDSTTNLEQGQALVIRTSQGAVEFEFSRASKPDEFDKWAVNRDREVRQAKAYQYVSRHIYGADALDDHGTWRFVSEVGYCWFPSVGSHWVPYRYGHWTWLDYYGWTWMPVERWGWATAHWGRWHHDVLHGWGWYAGAPQLRHIWRPALVSFIGTGFGRIGARHLAWAPLAPGELFRPWYGRSLYGHAARGTSTSTNIVLDNSVNIINNYRYARSNTPVSAVSYLDSDEFGSGRRNTPRGMRLAQSAGGVAIRGPLPVVPTRASQGRILPASSSSVRAAAPNGWGRVPASRLRDGTARVPFDDQRAFLRSSVDAFNQRYGTGSAASASNTSTRARPAPSGARSGPAATAGSAERVSLAPTRPTAPLQAQRPAATVAGNSRSTTGAASPVGVPSGAAARQGLGASRAVRATTTTATPAAGATPRSAAVPPSRVYAPRQNSRTGVPAIATRTERSGVSRTVPTVSSPQSRRVPTATRSRSSVTSVPSSRPSSPATVFVPSSGSRVGSSGSRARTTRTPARSSRPQVRTPPRFPTTAGSTTTRRTTTPSVRVPSVSSRSNSRAGSIGTVGRPRSGSSTQTRSQRSSPSIGSSGRSGGSRSTSGSSRTNSSSASRPSSRSGSVGSASRTRSPSASSRRQCAQPTLLPAPAIVRAVLLSARRQRVAAVRARAAPGQASVAAGRHRAAAPDLHRDAHHLHRQARALVQAAAPAQGTIVIARTVPGR